MVSFGQFGLARSEMPLVQPAQAAAEHSWPLSKSVGGRGASSFRKACFTIVVGKPAV